MACYYDSNVRAHPHQVINELSRRAYDMLAVIKEQKELLCADAAQQSRKCSFEINRFACCAFLLKMLVACYPETGLLRPSGPASL